MPWGSRYWRSDHQPSFYSRGKPKQDKTPSRSAINFWPPVLIPFCMTVLLPPGRVGFEQLLRPRVNFVALASRIVEVEVPGVGGQNRHVFAFDVDLTLHPIE